MSTIEKGLRTQEEAKEDLANIRKYCKAELKDDYELADEFFKKIRIDPEILVLLKYNDGADYIRQFGYNTTLADRAYGSDWLDREDWDWLDRAEWGWLIRDR